LQTGASGGGKSVGISKKVLNAAEYGSKFKGTGAVKGVSASQRGFNNRLYNHVVKDNIYGSRVINGTTKGATVLGYTHK
jgi:hypothetical protein